MTKEKKVMEELYFHMIENWETFKNHYYYPHKHPIGINTGDKTFKNETELKKFIQSDHDAVNMWMDHQWLQSASNIYNTNIHILTNGVETPRWTKLQPSSKISKSPNQTVQDNIYLLHADNSHFHMLVPKINPDTLVLTDEEQNWMEDKMNLTEIEPSEIDILRPELAESKKEIMILQNKVLELVSKEKLDPSSIKVQTTKETSENNICDDCGKNFAKFINLEAHVRQEHKIGQTLNCTSCKNIYSSNAKPVESHYRKPH